MTWRQHHLHLRTSELPH